MTKNRSAETGKFVTEATAKKKPATTVAVNDKAARDLRKMARIVLGLFCEDYELKGYHIINKVDSNLLVEMAQKVLKKK